MVKLSATFHKGVPFSYTNRIFKTVRQTPQHTCQILTNRRAKQYRTVVTRFARL
ncbi:DUF5131 family protein [Neisseria dentiae]|uniref:DUF5131 family protein n=1 Tax=Neisseria dentiae TaxID=194197 RepID=UPI00359F8416